MWFQKNAVPNVDETYIDVIEYKGHEYELRLVDGRIVKSQAVVMAPGLAYTSIARPNLITCLRNSFPIRVITTHLNNSHRKELP